MSSEITVKCFPLAGTQDYQVEDFQNYLAMRTPGVYGAGGNLKVQQATIPAMTVNILTGVAWLLAGDMAGVSFPIRTDKVLDIEIADLVNPRVDSIVCGLNKTTREGYLKVVKGEWSGSAPAPVRDATYYEIVLAHVSVPANTTEITDALITDTRADFSLCGISRDNAQGIIMEGHTSDRPVNPPAPCQFYDVDIRQMYFYSVILGEWSPQ